MLKKLPAAFESRTRRKSVRKGRRRAKAWSGRPQGRVRLGGVESMRAGAGNGMLVGFPSPAAGRARRLLALASAAPILPPRGRVESLGPAFARLVQKLERFAGACSGVCCLEPL